MNWRVFWVEKIVQRWLLSLVSATALAALAVMAYFHNQSGIFPLGRLPLAGLLALPLFLLLAYGINTFVWPTWQRISLLEHRKIILLALTASALVVWLAPAPRPDLRQLHHLVIVATGDKQEIASNSLVEIRRLEYLDGQPIPREQIMLTPDWQWSGAVLYSAGGPGSRLEIRGDMPAGIRVDLRYFNEGGQAQILWDGVRQDYDLFSRESTVLPLTFLGAGLASLPFAQALLVAGLWLLYSLGLLAIFGLGLVGLRRLAGERFDRLAFGLGLIGLSLVFLFLKVSGLRADAPRIFRDSVSYVETAQRPLASPAFWAGTRSFTLPLFLKIMGTTLENFQSPAQLNRIAWAQAALSALCWGLLALALMQVTANRWLRLVLFGGVLFFSLSLEIGLWDALLLSESLSFSLFALLIAVWAWLLAELTAARPAWLRWAAVGFTLLVSLLYSFVRDSNIYFVLMGVAVLVLGWLIQPRLAQRRTRSFCSEIWAFAGLMLALLVIQLITMSAGNRWQIFMYDHLAVRFLNDPQATQFFASQGLPVTDRLMQTTEMSGVEYQKLLMEAPEMQPVRDWVNQRSKSAYIQYLLSNPRKAFLEPLDHAGQLINGSNLEYRSPAFGVRPAPAKLVELNALFFNHHTILLILFGLACALGVIAYLLRRQSSAWVIVAALVLSLYPFMFLIWHAEPLEVERHAAQLGVQLRLAGWLALVLWVENGYQWISRKIVPKK